MVWRATSEEGRNKKVPVRKQQMHQRIQSNLPVGLLAFEENMPVGWVSIAPRETYRRLGGEQAKQNELVWSLACMFIRRSLRGKGLAHKLIAAAIDHAGKNGATHIEAYPVAPDAPSYRFMGFVPAFETAGFSHYGMAGKRRHVMRLTLQTNQFTK